MIIAFFLGCILLGLILAVIMAPIIVFKNQSTLKKMKGILKAGMLRAKAKDPHFYEWRGHLIDQLYDLKSTIVADNRSLIEADDIIARFKDVTS